MLPLASNSKASIYQLTLAVVFSSVLSASSAFAQQTTDTKKISTGELRILPPPGSTQPAQRARQDLVDQVLGVEKDGDSGTEIKLPASVMGLRPGDVTGDPISVQREQSRLRRTDAEISATSGAGEFERKLGDFDRVLEVTEEENKPMSPSFIQATKKIRELFTQKRYEDALVETNELLLHYSKSPLLWTMKGTLHLRLSQTDLSLAAYEKAFDLEPGGRLLAQIEQLRRLVGERETLRQKKAEGLAPLGKSGEGRAP